MNLQRIAAAVLLVGCGAALWALNRRGASGEITPRPLLYLVADTEREAERIPLELTRVSDEKENQIGDSLARAEGLQNFPESQQTDEYKRVTRYLNAVGNRLTGSVTRPAIRYRFYYIPEDYFVNAAAMPGGRIVVGRGLLRLLDTEDELAAILGHEIAHVDARHSIERMQYEMAARRVGLDGIYALGEPAVQLFEAGYTKEQEADADRMGLTFAVNAGYSPQGAVDAMKRLQELESFSRASASSPEEELADIPALALEEYFRSHPPASERVAAFQKQIEDEHLDTTKFQRPLAVRTIFRTEQARAYDRRGEFQKAIARYREAIEDDGTYAPARRGLVVAEWRSGDAQGALEAASGALRVDSDDVETWRLLALATATQACKTAVETMTGYVHANPPKSPFASRAMVVEAQGVSVFCNEQAEASLRDYAGTIAGVPGVAREAELRMIMANWLYRAGRYEDGLKELDVAHQESPSTDDPQAMRALILSDLGRQADALGVASNAGTDPAERNAVSAVIHSRTEQRDLARQEFAQAAQADPVWMEPQWPGHNFTAKTAAVLNDLRNGEIARRKQEEAKIHRAVASDLANPR